jgi:hypothetical protein
MWAAFEQSFSQMKWKSHNHRTVRVHVTVIEYRTKNGIFSGELRSEIVVLGKRLLKLSGRLLKLGFEALGVELVLHRLGSLYLGGCMALQKLAPLMRDGGVACVLSCCQSHMVRIQHLMTIETGRGQRNDLINHSRVSEIRFLQSSHFGIPTHNIITVQKNLLI